MSTRMDRWRLWCSAHVSRVALSSSSRGIGAIIVCSGISWNTCSEFVQLTLFKEGTKVAQG